MKAWSPNPGLPGNSLNNVFFRDRYTNDGALGKAKEWWRQNQKDSCLRRKRETGGQGHAGHWRWQRSLLTQAVGPQVYHDYLKLCIHEVHTVFQINEIGI